MTTSMDKQAFCTLCFSKLLAILFLVMRSSVPEEPNEGIPPTANLVSMEELPALIETTVAIVTTSRWEAPTDFLLSNDYQLTPNQQ